MLASSSANQVLDRTIYNLKDCRHFSCSVSSPFVPYGKKRDKGPKSAFHAINRDDMLLKAKQFYEEAWAGNLELMDELIAEDHAQRDRVWQEEPRIGRDKLRKGVKYFRSIYPDIRFTVQEGAACAESQKWSMTGTFEGEATQSSGVSLMSFDDSGLIAETQVYRQALPAEVILAQRSKRVNPVEQGVLLE